MRFHLSEQGFEDLSVESNKDFNISTESGEFIAASGRNVKRLSCFNAPPQLLPHATAIQTNFY